MEKGKFYCEIDYKGSTICTSQCTGCSKKETLENMKYNTLSDKIRNVSTEKLAQLLGVSKTTAKRERKKIQNSLGLKRRLVMNDLKRYYKLD